MLTAIAGPFVAHRSTTIAWLRFYGVLQLTTRAFWLADGNYGRGAAAVVGGGVGGAGGQVGPFKQLRGLYIELLSSQLKELRITAPFNAMPPPGPLPKLPQEVRGSLTLS